MGIRLCPTPPMISGYGYQVMSNTANDKWLWVSGYVQHHQWYVAMGIRVCPKPPMISGYGYQRISNTNS
ncbi:hypothetical protein BgiMline_010314, partial [Biomphalaria glabrata]